LKTESQNHLIIIGNILHSPICNLQFEIFNLQHLPIGKVRCAGAFRTDHTGPLGIIGCTNLPE